MFAILLPFVAVDKGQEGLGEVKVEELLFWTPHHVLIRVVHLETIQSCTQRIQSLIATRQAWCHFLITTNLLDRLELLSSSSVSVLLLDCLKVAHPLGFPRPVETWSREHIILSYYNLWWLGIEILQQRLAPCIQSWILFAARVLLLLGCGWSQLHLTSHSIRGLACSSIIELVVLVHCRCRRGWRPRRFPIESQHRDHEKKNPSKGFTTLRIS